MRFLSLILAFTATAVAAPYVNAQKCLDYNTLKLRVTYHDVCVSGSCMNSTTFIPDFDIPDDDPKDQGFSGYKGGIRTTAERNNYPQNFCAAVSTPMTLRPKDCDSVDCTDDGCRFSIYNGNQLIRGITGLARNQVQPYLVREGVEGEEISYPVFRNVRDDYENYNYAQGVGVKSIASEETFYKWYHDSNATAKYESELTLTRIDHSQVFQYQNSFFFPLDGLGFKDTQNDGSNDHNFGFTTHIFSEFVYTGGEKFTFQGDDDVWVFIDDKLVIDMGGLHPPLCRTISLDEAVNDQSGAVYDCQGQDYKNVQLTNPTGQTYTITNLTPNSRHNISIFHAERHKTQSTFAMSTSIGFHQGDTFNGLDLTLPSATGARIYIGEYDFNLRQWSPSRIQLPTYTGTDVVQTIPIILEFPPVAPTQFSCRLLPDDLLAFSNLDTTFIDRNTIVPPFNVAYINNVANQATWASVTSHDFIATSCSTNSTDQPTYYINVTAKAVGSGVLYCLAVDVPGVTYSDYTAEGKTRGNAVSYYRKWVAASITNVAPTTQAPTTKAPTTEAPTTQAPTTEAPTTQAPTTQAPTTEAPTTATPTTQAPTTEAPTTQGPTTATPTTEVPTTATTTEAPTTQAPTTQSPTTATPTTATPSTAAPTTVAPTNTTSGSGSGSNSTSSSGAGSNSGSITNSSSSTGGDLPSEIPIPTDIPTETPTEQPTTAAPVDGASGAASQASSGLSTATKLAIIIPAAVGGSVVVVLLFIAIYYCMKRRANAVTNTRRTQMEMV